MVWFDKKEDGSVDVTFTINAVPMKIYEEFISTAKREYGGCFWMYLKDMMSKAKQYDMIELYGQKLYQVEVDIEELKQYISSNGKEDHESIEHGVKVLGE